MDITFSLLNLVLMISYGMQAGNSGNDPSP